MTRQKKWKPVINVRILPRPRALDIFSGGGGAGTGLRQAGFSTVVGIDIEDHGSSYEHLPGMHFRKCDYRNLTPDFVAQFDFVWASPPCQAFSQMVFQSQRERFLEEWQKAGRHINHIPPVRSLLKQSGVPYCIENVQGAKSELKGPLLKLCGTMFDLQVFRHRFFEFGNGILRPENAPECNHEGRSIGILKSGVRPPRTESCIGQLNGTPPGFKKVKKEYASGSAPDRKRVDHIYIPSNKETKQKVHETYKRSYVRSLKEAMRITGQLSTMSEQEKTAERMRYEREMQDGLPEGSNIQMYPIYGKQMSRGLTEEWREAMGMHTPTWLPNRDEVREAIPPAFSDFIGRHVLRSLRVVRNAKGQLVPSASILCKKCTLEHEEPVPAPAKLPPAPIVPRDANLIAGRTRSAKLISSRGINNTDA